MLQFLSNCGTVGSFDPTERHLRWHGNRELSVRYKCLIEKLKPEENNQDSDAFCLPERYDDK
jgi:hypothetical protein